MATVPHFFMIVSNVGLPLASKVGCCPLAVCVRHLWWPLAFLKRFWGQGAKGGRVMMDVKRQSSLDTFGRQRRLGSDEVKREGRRQANSGLKLLQNIFIFRVFSLCGKGQDATLWKYRGSSLVQMMQYWSGRGVRRFESVNYFLAFCHHFPKLACEKIAEDMRTK